MMGAWVEIRNNATGEVRRYRDEYFNSPGSASVYLWTDGNYGCDCNRSMFFARAGNEAEDDDEPDVECGDEKFSALRAHCDDGQVINLSGDE